MVQANPRSTGFVARALENTVKRLIGATILAFGFLLAACGGDDDTETASQPTNPPATAPTATVFGAGVARGTLGGGQAVKSLDGKLEVSAKTPLELEIKASDARLPSGWKFLTPVYVLTATQAGKPVITPTSPLELSFNVSPGPGTVMAYVGVDWIILDTENELKGTLKAQSAMVSAFVVARPAVGTVTRISATATATSSVPTVVKAPPTAVASNTVGAATPEPSVSPSPTAKASVTAGSAASALLTSVARFKGKSPTIAEPTKYVGSGLVPLPPNIETAMATLAARGELHYGLYHGVNEVVTAGATLGASGTFALLVEPRTAFPGNTTEAQAELVSIFPGATGLKYAPSVSNANAYTFYANSGPSIFVLGFITYQGLPIAFMATGSGAYYGLAFGTGTLQ